VLLPNIIAGSLGCGILYLLGDFSTADDYFNTFYAWVIGNIPCALIFGLLILKTLTPVLKSCNLYYEGFFK
jgi:integral membrane sensor domain MASE1